MLERRGDGTCGNCGLWESCGRYHGLGTVVSSGRRKRKRDMLIPLLEHAIADLNEFPVRFNVGLQFP
jgi:hypothetical protein